MHKSATHTRLPGLLALALAATSGILGVAAPAALAKKATPTKTVESSETAPAGGGVCEGQSFSQAFLAYGDSRSYTLAPGGEFNSVSEGWTLSGRASISTGVRPDGSTGGVLDLPAGSKAISPPMCVTLSYPSARAWISDANGERGITVSVSYAGTLSATTPEETGVISGKKAWTLGEFALDPTLAGQEEAPREVRFVLETVRGNPKLYGIYVDPRLSR